MRTDRPDSNLALAAIIGCLAMVGCVSSGPRSAGPTFQKVTDSNKRYEFTDFVVKPPPGNDWYALQPQPQADLHGITFFKKLPTRHYPATHSFFVVAQSEPLTNMFATPKDFQAYAQQRSEQMDPRRHKLLQSRCAIDPRFGGYCVRFQSEAEDFGARVGGAVLLLEMTGYMFLHPSATNRLVVLTYSERGRSDELDPSLNEAGEKFIGGFEATPLK